jgi:hypothetical protein
MRMGGHRRNYNVFKMATTIRLWFMICLMNMGLENCKIELVELFPCTCKAELEAREGFYIKNNECVNRITVGRTRKEYYEENKEKILELDKQYKQDNRERISKTEKEYYEVHKDEFIEKAHIV